MRDTTMTVREEGWILTHRAAGASVADVADAAGRVSRVPSTVHVAAARGLILQVLVVDRLTGTMSTTLASGCAFTRRMERRSSPSIDRSA